MWGIQRGDLGVVRLRIAITEFKKKINCFFKQFIIVGNLTSEATKATAISKI